MTREETLSIPLVVTLDKKRRAELSDLAKRLPGYKTDNDKALKTLLKGLALAGVHEYVEQATGSQSPASLAQVREARLISLSGISSGKLGHLRTW